MNKVHHWSCLLTIYALCNINAVIGNATLFRSVCKKRAAFQLVRKNTRLNAVAIATEVAHSPTICSLKCTHHSLCRSINYNIKTKKCEILSGDRTTVGESELAASNSWEYYEPENLQVTTLLYI